MTEHLKSIQCTIAPHQATCRRLGLWTLLLIGIGVGLLGKIQNAQ